MTRSIWRLSHLSLALVASLFLILASISGLFLAFEPIQNRMDNKFSTKWNAVPLSTAVDSLKAHNYEVTSIERDQNGYYVATVFTEDGEQLSYQFNPESGQKTGDVIKQSSFYQWMTTFHRSLFLDQIGRFFVGLTSLILIFIAISGIVLVIQRSRSLKSLVDKVEKTLNVQFYHIVFGRLAFIPILFISVTGAYLFLQRFEVIKKVETPLVQVDFENLAKDPETFEFSKIEIADIVKVDFPLFPDEEEFFVVQLTDRILAVNQFDFSVLSEVEIPQSTVWSNLSLDLHTGRTNVVWAFILGLASISILYFIYSGFKMTLLKQRAKTKNRYKLNESELLILVGSESGNTQNYAKLVFNELIKAGVKVHISELNNYKSSASIKSILVFTATYGNGDAPANAAKFLSKWKKDPVKQDFTYSIVGFGSLAYPDFCQFAMEIEQVFQSFPNAQQLTPLSKIHNQSYHSLKTWASSWKSSSGYALELPASLEKEKMPGSALLLLDKQTVVDHDHETFVLRFKVSKEQRFQSGDLIAFYPPTDPFERYYSIGKISKDEFVISVKLHDKGICSNYLNALELGQQVEASFKRNVAFHFNPKRAAILIGNGTGIGPFLGMIQENWNRNEVQLYWGGKSQLGFSLYKSYVEQAKEEGMLSAYHCAYSKGEEGKVYVGDLVQKDGELIAKSLKNGAIIYICGSLAMQQDVLAFIDKSTLTFSNRPLSYYQKKGQLRMDCY